MAREIVTHVLCDVCMIDDVRTEAEEIPPTTIGNLKPRVLALCEPHKKEFFDPFHELLRDQGQVHISDQLGPRSPASSSDEKIPCPLCGKSMKNMGSLKSHGYAMHDMPHPEMRRLVEQQAQGTLDLSQRVAAAVDLEDAEEYDREDCGQPGCDVYYAKPRHSRPTQAVGIHRARAHGIRSKRSAAG